MACTAGVPVGKPLPELDSYVQKGEALKASKREAAPKISFPTL